VPDAPVRIKVPQCCDAHDLLLRQRDLAVQRSQYEWVHTPGLPPYCRGVPACERFTGRQRDRMAFDVIQSVVNAATASVKWIKRKPGKIGDYSLFYPLRRRPAVAARWMQDKEFGRQRLDGINPFMIAAIDEIPDHFPVTDELLGGVLPEGVRLEQLLGEGRLFMTDYSALDDAPSNIGCYLTAPISLFWLDDQRQVMPLAIQLGQSPADAPVIFTPSDPRWVWLTARTFVQEADGNHHEIVDHLTRTHLVMEAFWVAACRTLPPQHPIHALLGPHFMGTIQINDEARTLMVAPGGPIDATMAVGSEGSYWLIAQEYATWSFADWNPRRQLEARGVLDPARLPNFHFRDDAIRLFDAIGVYAAELLAVFYRGDDDVVADHELQDWINELVADDGGRVKGLPLRDGRLVTFSDLIELVQLVLYVVSCEHAAVNNGQYDLFGYIPNTPGALFLPAPTDKSLIDEAEFVYFLPMPDGVEKQIGMVSLLSEPTLTPLGHYDDLFFQCSADARLAVDRFQSALADIQLEIDRRNQSLDVPYSYLSPASVGRSIAI
jgi:Lipoxygenase